MRIIFLFTLWLNFLGILHAQPRSLYFKKINTENGLSHNKVNCILQDKRGFIWIGTEDGLNRYDGNDFLIFRSLPGRSDCISGNIITDLYEDKNSVLWIATADGGLSRYDYTLSPKDQFKQYKNQQDQPASIPVNTINALLEDRMGYLWLATGGNLVLRFNKQTEVFEEPVKTGTRTALSIGLDHKDILWVGRQGGGLLKIDTRTLEYESDPRYDNLYAKLPHVAVTSLYEDKDQHMWFGSWDKILFQYHSDMEEEIWFEENTDDFSFRSDEISDITEDGEGNLWMGGRNAGLQMYDKTTNRFYKFRFDPALAGTIADDRVNCVFIDNTGHIWAGTNKGISTATLEQQFIQHFLPGKFKYPLTPVTIFDFYKDDRETIWMGTSNGIYYQENGRTTIHHLSVSYKGEPVSVSKFYKDIDGSMYLGTNYSFFKYNEITQRISVLPNTEKDGVMSRIIQSRVVSVVRDTIDGHPVLLMSPYGHFLAYYDLNTLRWVSRLDTVANIVDAFNLNDHLIRKFYRGRNGQLWLAMGSKGLGLWDKTPRPYVKYFANNPSDPTSLSNNHVYDLVEDDEQNFWVTTYGGGLQYFNTKDYSFKHIASSGNLLEGIQRDDLGRLWMVGRGILHMYNVTDSSFVSFDLPDLENTGGVRGNIYKDQEGLLYVSGPNYFIRFNPLDIEEEKTMTEVLFTDFRIFNNSFSHLLFEKEIKLRYNQNYFTVEFAAPHYPGSERMNYRYMLEGVDEDWVYTGTHNSASYPNTGSGDFLFRVQASTDNGRWHDQVATLMISVIPPFWKTWWFYTLCSIAIISIILSIQRYRENELLKRQTIRNRIAQDLHDNIGSTLSSISVYSQVARIQNEKQGGEELNELLGKIGSTSNDMISEMNDIVWAINPRNDSMEKIIQRMESFARPLLATRNIQLDFSYDPEILQINLDMEKRKNFYLIFKEVINNAFKYSGCSTINVDIRVLRNQLTMRIKDNGVGFRMDVEDRADKMSLSGNGLDNIRSRSAEMNGAVKIHSTEGQGTEIELSINIP